jgi:hypothetical protein
MLYFDFPFSITEDGFRLIGTDTEMEPHQQVKVEKTPLNVGDTFTLELDETGNMFFRKNGPVQYELDFHTHGI